MEILKTRSFKIKKQDWEKVRFLAYKNNITSSEIVRRAIKNYVIQNGQNH